MTFERKMGSEGVRRMLTEGEKLNAHTALELGFVDVIVADCKGKSKDGDHESLVDSACQFAEKWVSEGRGRTIVEQGLVEQLDLVNAREGQQLADAMFSTNFWAATLGKAMGRK